MSFSPDRTATPRAHASAYRRLTLATLAAAACATLSVSAMAQDAPEDIEFKVGEMSGASSQAAITRDGLVQVVLDADDGLSDAEVKAIGKTAGVELALNSIYSDDANLYVGWVERGKVQSVLDKINASDGVEAAEVNQRVSAFNFPNDPLYQYQWHMDQIHAKKAWKTSSGKDVVVAVLDTGVAYSDKGDEFKQVKDLSGTKMAPGYDFVDDDAFPHDEHGHGTHVAGTIAQTTNNGYGVAGVAYNAQIMPIRVLNKHGMGSTSDIADGIRWAADNGAKVINMSLGGPLPSFVMRSAVQYAHSKGVTVVAAAGNAGRRMRSYPAAYKNVIAVAATQYDRKTTFYSQWGKFVDIAAPGGNTRVDQNKDGRPDGVLQQTISSEDPLKHDFSLFMGTSMAAPHVAGAAAILVSLGINNPSEVERILKETASDSEKGSSEDYSERYGAGILDVNAAATNTVTCFGFTRLSIAGVFAFFLLAMVRRKDMLAKTSLIKFVPMAVGLVLASSGLFFLPLFFGGEGGVLGTAISALGSPIANLDTTLLGPAFHQNALLASALLPIGAMLVGLQNTTLRSLAVGLAIGFAAYLGVEAFFMTSDVQWIPSMSGTLDRVWLGANAVVCLGAAYLGLKRY